jgi:hypothetical protein
LDSIGSVPEKVAGKATSLKSLPDRMNSQNRKYAGRLSEKEETL